MKKISTIAVMMLILLLSTSLYAAQTDNAKCKEHPMFTRMPGSYIYNCDQKQFDGRDFKIVEKGKPDQLIHVEGQLWWYTCYVECQAQNSFLNQFYRPPSFIMSDYYSPACYSWSSCEAT